MAQRYYSKREVGIVISWNDFEHTVVTQLYRDIRRQSNPEQHDTIVAPLNQSLFIPAGPGSGKTTVITLKVLKLIFVDNVDPSHILVTTFTRKAAAELRSRILGWGDQMKRIFLSHPSYVSVRNQLQIINFNNIITGTLDSIAEEIMGDYRAPGAPSPVVIEDFVSNSLMVRVGLFEHGRHNNQILKNYITSLRGAWPPLNPSEISKILREINDRVLHDQININLYRSQSSDPGIPIVCDAIDDYNQELRNRLLYDFARLEHEFLTQLQARTLSRFLQDIKFVLVDEYQDSNYLQEQIYFELARAALMNGGSMTVVGDDDQSLYRFRGATVDLFQSFSTRTSSQLGISPPPIYLSRNYRSTPLVVDFCNRFITLDRQFQNVRVAGKPSIIAARQIPSPSNNYPILGMFRNDVNTLSHDLAQFIDRVIHGGGFQIQHQNNQYIIQVDQIVGSPADVAILCSSPQEFGSGENPRLPLLLRRELNGLSSPIQIFNPRGQSLEKILDVQILCGLILECIDPNSEVQNNIPNLPQDARTIFGTWRSVAINFINNNPVPATQRNLREFVNAWQHRIPLRRQVRSGRWEVPLVDLVYKIVTWIPNMQNDIEGLVYLEAITRTMCQAGLFCNYEAEIIIDPTNPNLEQASVKEALWNIFMPIAVGVIDINEDLLETLPSDRINLLSIHQAKGLEFPLVIVDVGSDFKKNHHTQAFKRFPREGGRVCNMEDTLRPFSPMGRPQRPALDRAFDDLIRHYFVSYSRAQDVLLLVGLDSAINSVQNIATGWDRNGNWHWGRGLLNLLHI